MADPDELAEGDHVTWNTPQGETEGEVVEVATSDVQIKGTTLRASEDDPRVIVESATSGERAGHKPESVDEA